MGELKELLHIIRAAILGKREEQVSGVNWIQCCVVLKWRGACWIHSVLVWSSVREYTRLRCRETCDNNTGFYLQQCSNRKMQISKQSMAGRTHRVTDAEMF